MEVLVVVVAAGRTGPAHMSPAQYAAVLRGLSNSVTAASMLRCAAAHSPCATSPSHGGAGSLPA